MSFWIFIFALFVIWSLFFKKKKPVAPKVNNKKPINKVSSGKSTNNLSNIHSRAPDEDELATFTFINEQVVDFHARQEQPQKNLSQRHTTPARWIKPDESVTIENIVINGGYFYFGGQLKAGSSGEHHYRYNDNSDASLVNSALSIQHASVHHQDESLGYWPSFSTLSPLSRGAYLSWLASDRNDASCPIGYVFIYFYGLERRILVDGAQKAIPADEFKSLFGEVSRLRSIFKLNNSFYRYSTQLIETMLLLRPDVIKIENESDYFASGSSLLFRFRLATVVEQGEPLPVDLALAWVKYYAEYALRTPARRCVNEFTALFKQRYADKFNNGLIIKPNKTRLELNYYPASSTLRGINIEHLDLPDPSVLRAPVQKLIQIAESCTDSLDAYSRYLGKKEASRSDIAAIMLLPDEVLNEDAEHTFTKFKLWADEQISENAGLVKVASFWAILDIPAPDKINKKEAELIQNFIERTGYGVAPDTRYHHVKPEPDGNIVLFLEGHGEFFTPSTEFLSVSVALRLGAMIAQMDQDVDITEQIVLEKTIDHNGTLSPTEKRSLHAYLRWLLNTPANMAGLKNKIEQLNGKEKSTIGNVILRVACADGKIDLAEIKQLEKIYSSLGLDSKAVTNDLHHLSMTGKTSEHRTQTVLERNNIFSLDEHALARHESDTANVHQLLSTIFEEDSATEERPKDIPSNSIVTLDETHHQLYQLLLAKNRWERNEVAELCQQLNLMLIGAIEAINDWSFEQVDAPLLDEDDDGIYVDLEIAQELKG